MSESFPARDDGRQECLPSQSAPKQIIESILEQGRASGKGLAAFVEAASFARRHSWKEIENDLYARLGLMLVRGKDPLDEATVELLAAEVSAPHFDDVVPTSLRTLLAAMSSRHVGAGSPTLLRLATAFESRTEAPGVAWHARLMTNGFLGALERIDPALASQTRRRITKRVSDWTIEYHITEDAADLDLRTRGTFRSILASEWTQVPAENVASGLDGAFHCAIERLTRADCVGTSWFVPWLDELTPEVAATSMHRRLARETLYRIAELLGSARRAVYARQVAAALAITTLEEAIHRPHRRQLDHGAMKLDLELPGPRGFGRGTRLRVFDISRDGCLAVTGGPARFEETSSSPAELRRAAGRSFNVRRLAGTLRQGSVEWDVRPETPLVLHDASRRIPWADIDGASIVRVSDDRASERLWLGFHFDRVVPAVQREIETLVYGAA